ncbi:MAG: methyltransferase domain-containing protein [Solirubrobacteraceae bacterium]
MLGDILRCPTTGESLRLSDGYLQTPSDERRYTLTDGVLILVAPERSLFGASAVQRAAPLSRVRRARIWLRRRLTANPISAKNLHQLAELLQPSADGSPAPRRRVLVIGAGIVGFGVEQLLEADWLEVIETDVHIGPRTMIVCDAHDLPFVDGSFQAVVVQAVLEHVIDPVRVVAEIHRILAPSGLIYSEIPFMQQVHEGPYDFTRWTLGGHRRLLRDFDEIASGAVGGPGEALAWSLRYFAVALAGNSAIVRQLVSPLAVVATLPLRWADRWLGERPAGVDASSGTYILGRRREQPRTDREIVAAYEGLPAVDHPDYSQDD